MKRFKYILILLFLAASITSCHKSSEVSNIFIGYDYFPLKQGSWILYKVDSVFYSPFGTDSSSWLMKEVIDSIYTDGQGVTNGIVKRYSTSAENPAWNIPPVVWNVSLSSITAEKVEDNIRYVKLEFPIKNGLKWNGNYYNGEPEQVFTYKWINQGGIIGNFVFDSLLKVNQQDFSTLISKDFSEEVYAVGIGSVYIHKEHLSNLLASKTGYTYNAEIIDWSD